MKVKELIQILNEFNQEDEVILSSDSEGNSYYQFDTNCIADGFYIDDGYGIEIVSPSEEIEDMKDCIIIYPY